MSAPRVSVVIPAWNAAAFIVKTLESIKAQTFTDYEVLVTDDGSKDDTHGVVSRWLRERGVSGSCIRQENMKIAGARNTAMRAARGELLAFLDHDDLWYPRKLEKSVAAFDANPGAVLVGSHIEAKKDGRLVALLKKGPAVPRMYEHLLFEGNSVAPSAAVVRRETALAIGGFREDPRLNTVEDYDFWLRLSRTGEFVYIDEALASYTIVENSASSRVEYHHSNLEHLLRLHFAEHCPDPDGATRCRMRRRLAMVYRSAAGALLAAKQDRAKQGEYVRKMLAEWPCDLKNLGRAAQYLIG